MNKIKITFFFIFTSTLTNAQFRNKSLPNNGQIKILLEPEQSAIEFGNYLSHVNIIDARTDSNAIGFYSRIVNQHNNPVLYKIFPSTQIGIGEWITNYLKIDTTLGSLKATLLLVIKKFWLSLEASPTTNDNGNKVQPKELGFDPGMITQLEFYLEKDSIFYPMYKIDSIYTFPDKTNEYTDFYITATLKKSLDKLIQIDFNSVLHSARKLSIEAIQNHIWKTGEIPILNAKMYKKGVYESFEAFKNNAPSVVEFELKSGKLGDVLHVIENGSSYPMRNAWGFCDGKDIYINSSDKYSKLIKEQGTFYFSGIKGIKTKLVPDLMHSSLFTLATGSEKMKTQYSATKKYYIVDMETGEVY